MYQKVLIFAASQLVSYSCYASLAELSTEEKCRTLSEEEGVIDEMYHYLNTKICQPVVWVDDFFINEWSSLDERAGARLRWKNDFRYFEDSGFDYETSIDASVKLRHLNKRFKLIIASNDEDDLFDLFPRSAEELESNVGLSYDWFMKRYSSFDIRATFRPSLEARYRFTYPLGRDLTFRFTQKVYQKRKTSGESSRFDLDYRLTEDLKLRWTTYAEYNWDYDDREDQWDLGAGLTLFHYISDKQAMKYFVSTTAIDEPRTHISNTRLGMSYRHNIFYDWLFYELTPEFNWDREYKESFEKEASIRLRIEILFDNS